VVVDRSVVHNKVTCLCEVNIPMKTIRSCVLGKMCSFTNRSSRTIHKP